MSNSLPRIGIDCRLAGSQHAGIGRYVENVVKRLPSLADSIHWVFFFHDQEQAKTVLGAELDRSNVEIVITPIRHYSLAEQMRMPQIFVQQKLDLLHVPHFNIALQYKGPLVVTIHDLLWHEYQGAHVTTLPGWQYWLKYRAYLYTVGKAVRRASHIIVPAETVKKTVIKYYPETKNKIVVTKEGVDKHFLQKTSTKNNAAIKEAKIQKLLYVGSLYPHKNLRLVIDALAKLPNYQLLIVGTRNVFQEQIRQYVKLKGSESQVEFLGYVSDEKLIELYKQATALVQPSFSEGFGLTGVEAMAAGVPVLASNIPLFKEIYQNGAIFFDPYDVESFVQAVKKLEKTPRLSLVRTARQVSQQYDWDKMVKETLAVYQQVLAEHHTT